MKILFTDSKNKDFEFFINSNASLVTMFYRTESGRNIHIRSLISSISFEQIEIGDFPSSLNDFKEATSYLQKTIKNLAFL